MLLVGLFFLLRYGNWYIILLWVIKQVLRKYILKSATALIRWHRGQKGSGTVAKEGATQQKSLCRQSCRQWQPHLDGTRETSCMWVSHQTSKPLWTGGRSQHHTPHPLSAALWTTGNWGAVYSACLPCWSRRSCQSRMCRKCYPGSVPLWLWESCRHYRCEVSGEARGGSSNE